MGLDATVDQPTSGNRTTYSNSLHARLLHGFDDLIVELGSDASVIKRRADLDPAESLDTYEATTRLLEAAATELGLLDFGLRLARKQSIHSLGPLSVAMGSARTLAEALTYVTTHSQAHSPAARIWMEERPEEDAVFIGHEIMLPGLRAQIQAMEQIQLLGQLSAIKTTGGVARACRVHFRHQPLSIMRVYNRYFGCDVRFGQKEDGLMFRSIAFDSRIISDDAKAFDAVTHFIDRSFPPCRRPVHVEARSWIIRLLATGRCKIADVAVRLAVHPRTLHRRLEAEGTTFQRLKDEVRCDVMLYYLGRTTLDLAVVSERLGFAEQAVMTRFCRKLFAMSPTGLRARSRAGTRFV